MTSRTASLLIPLLALAALVGCSPPDDRDEVPDALPDDETVGETPIASDTGCLVAHTWLLDLPDLASQTAAELAADGFSVVEYAGVGRYTLTFGEAGDAASSVDATLTMTVDTDTGVQITVTQVHVGEPRGQWGWLGDGHTLSFAEWDGGGYAVQNYLTVNGAPSEQPIPVPDNGLDGQDMRVECSESTLVTHSVGSPYTHRWTAER